MTLLLATLGTGCKSLEMQSDWVAAPILIDGTDGDWNDLHTAYLEDKQAVVGLANDSSQLFFMFRTRDPRSARLIAQTGLTLRLEAKDGDPELMLKFRAGPSRDDLNTLMGPDTGPVPPYPDREGPFGDSKGGPKLMVAIEDRVLQRPIALDGSLGPAAAFGVSKDMFTWEFSIPLEPSHVRYYGLGAGPNASISAVVTWGEFDRSSRPQPPEGVGGMGGGGRGGPGGGMGGGRPGGRGGGGKRPGGFSKPEKQEVKLKLLLAGPE